MDMKAVLKTARDNNPLSKYFSAESLSQKAYLSAFASVLEYGARLAVGFIINPLLVAGLGDILYGAWQVLGRLIGYISPASGRPAQALKWTVASQQASRNFEEKRRHVGSTLIVWLYFLPLLVVLGGLLAWFAPTWLDAPREYSLTVRLAAALLAANLILISLTDVPRAVLEGENLGFKRMGITALLVFVGGGLTALALYLNTGLVGVATATLATTLLTGVFFLQVVRTYVPWFGLAKPPIEAVRNFLGLSWWFLGWNLIMKLMAASDVVMLGILNSLEMVTIYTLTKYVPETLIDFVAIVVLGITPGLGGIIGSGDLKKAARVRNEIMVFTWLVITVAGSTIVLWNQSFAQLWVGSEYYAGTIANLLIVLMAMQFALIRNDAFIIDLTLKLRSKVILGALSVSVSLVLVTILVGPLNMGIIGLCLGFIVGRSILSVAYPWLVGRFLEVSILSQLSSLMRPVFITGLLYILMIFASKYMFVSTWIGLILSVGITLLVVSPLAFFAGLSLGNRQRVLERVRSVIQRADVD